MSLSLRSSLLGVSYYKALDFLIIPILRKSGLQPNQITLAGMLLAVMVPVGFLFHPALGLLFILLSGFADSLDGRLARVQNNDSRYGAFLDSTLDRLSDFFCLTGFWIMLWSQTAQWLATLLVLVALLSTLMISYVKARAESLNICCRVGLMERGMRVVFYMAWALALVLFPQDHFWILWIGLLLYILLTVSTVVQRIIHIRHQFETRGAAEP